MNLKSKFEQALRLYFMLVTLITVLLMILGFLFDADRTFGYGAYASPLVYAAIGVLPVFLPGQKKELSVKGLILRRICELAIVEIIIITLAFLSTNIPTDRKGVVVGIAGGIAVIYVFSVFFEYLHEKKEARRMNEILAEYFETTD